MRSFENFGEKFDIVATCASGVESVLKKEIERLGYGINPAENGTITFSGDASALARANINLRTADRIYIKIAEFSALSFDSLYDNISEISWEKFIPSNANVLVNGKCVKSKLFSISDCQKIIKKSIADRLCKKYKINRLIENGERYEIFFSIFKDTATIMLNSSGDGLHKRGYRDLVGVAPIKETLASALLLMSDFYHKRPFYDPFCGSGTLVIEGAKIALNIAPNLNRKFAFNYWKDFDEKFYSLAVEEALDNEKRDRKIEFYGSDIDSKAISLSNRHAERAGVKDYVNFKTMPVSKVKLPFEYGTIVTNPPYGERVFDKKEAESCYKDLRKVLTDFPKWSLFLITSYSNYEKCYGVKADRNRKMYNSNKECKYYFYYGKENKND
ncbi:MAG: class I SAM-dependent RNA methyltransferase [Clostridia bacterium]|nr:class I SAM-dependent RNA methyltransferase [Clostridia bacterium]